MVVIGNDNSALQNLTGAVPRLSGVVAVRVQNNPVLANFSAFAAFTEAGPGSCLVSDNISWSVACNCSHHSRGWLSENLNHCVA